MTFFRDNAPASYVAATLTPTADAQEATKLFKADVPVPGGPGIQALSSSSWEG